MNGNLTIIKIIIIEWIKYFIEQGNRESIVCVKMSGINYSLAALIISRGYY